MVNISRSNLRVDLLYWRFDEHHMGDAEGKAFIFESCSVGMTWLTADPIALSLLGNGSPAIVASIDAGGVSYFPPEYWASNHTLGKSPIGAIALLSFTLEDISPEVVFKIYVSWALMVLATYRKHSLFIFLLTPILLFIAFSAMAGLISVKYLLFLLVTGMTGTFILWLLLKLNLLLVKKFEQQLSSGGREFYGS